jgi:hypothetical protein
MNRVTRLLTAVCCLAYPAYTQDTGPDSAQHGAASITITSVPEGATVVLNSIVAGTTPFFTDTLQQGIYALTLVHPDMESWLTASIMDTFTITSEQPAVLHYEFEQRLFISSEPFGTEVYAGDSLLGVTPLLVPAVSQPLSIRRNRYESVPVESFNGHRGFVRVTLKPEWHPDGDNGAHVFRGLAAEQSPRIDLYATGGIALVAGVAAAYLKVRADNSYAEYLRTGDPAKLSRTHSLDTAAGIALATTQLALGLFTYFLFSD